jgi:hypothetical protein
MAENFDPVLGGQQPAGSDPVMGGLVGIEQALGSPNPKVRIQAIKGALRYGWPSLLSKPCEMIPTGKCSLRLGRRCWNRRIRSRCRWQSPIDFPSDRLEMSEQGIKRESGISAGPT